MDLVERYLQAVAFWLPRAQKRDIVAELSEDIRSELEEQEQSVGRPLNETEVSESLKRRGKPLAVAAAYLPKEQLIGPALFPVYKFVLKIVAACYLVPWAVAWLGLWRYSAAFRASHGGSSWIATLGRFWGDFWAVCLFTGGVVTIVFAVIERFQARARASEDWDPRRLPAVKDPVRIPRSTTVGELVSHLVFVILWISFMPSSVILDRPEWRVTLAPIWPLFFWSYLGIWFVAIATAGVNLFRPSWTARRAGVRLMTDLAGAVLFGALCSSNIVREVVVAGVAAERAMAITSTVNLAMSRGVILVIFIGAAVLASDIRRIARVRAASRPSTPPGATPS